MLYREQVEDFINFDLREFEPGIWHGLDFWLEEWPGESPWISLLPGMEEV